MKILLVDDEPEIRRIAKRSLEGLGKLSVTDTGSPVEAIDLATREVFDLILMDMMMPEMDGLTALRRLREREECRGVPVAFMTAKVQRGEVERYMSMGAVGVIQKPFDPILLPEQVKALAAR